MPKGRRVGVIDPNWLLSVSINLLKDPKGFHLSERFQ